MQPSREPPFYASQIFVYWRKPLIQKPNLKSKSHISVRLTFLRISLMEKDGCDQSRFFLVRAKSRAGIYLGNVIRSDDR
jgi:hypothetical protein